MGVPIKYRNLQEIPTVNYTFSEVITGKGIAVLYAGAFQANATRILSPSKFYSQNAYTTWGSGTSIDLDFDLEVLKPVILDGKAIINIPTVRENSSGSPQDVSTTVIANLKRVSAGIEYHIVSGAFALTGTVDAGAVDYEMLAIQLTVPTTKIKAGDTLRLKMQSTALAISNKTAYMFYDPNNRTGATDLGVSAAISTAIGQGGTVLQASLPVKIDLD